MLVNLKVLKTEKTEKIMFALDQLYMELKTRILYTTTSFVLSFKFKPLAGSYHPLSFIRLGGYDYFLLLLSKLSIWFTEKTLLKNYHIYFWWIKVCRKLCHLIWGIIWWFDRSKNFEAMKAEKLSIPPRLSCWFTENTLMDKLCYLGLYV